MEQTNQSSFIFHANQEHSGIRFTVILVLALSFVAIFIGLNLLISNLDSAVANFALALSCVLALPAALAFAYVAERYLKRNWPSGQQVSMSDDGLEVILANGRTVTINWSDRFTVLRWYFEIKGYARGGRERRVPANYYCLALQLQQDEERFVVQTYLPEKKVSGLIEGKDFLQIKPADYAQGGFVRRWVGSTDRPKIPTSTLAGREGPYWIAERRRWAEGLELDVNDLEKVLAMVDEKYAFWDSPGGE